MTAQYTFCPRDGTKLTVTPYQGLRKLPTCSRCGFVDYGNPKPCLAVLVEKDGRLLLGRRGVEPAKGKWDILGGFIEPGETAEAAVAREVLEETGLNVTAIRYLGSEPDIYGDHDVPTLNLCFSAAPDGESARPASDVAELKWFDRSELPVAMAFVHQDKVVKAWLQNLASGQEVSGGD